MISTTVKRLFDILLAAVILAVASPVMIAIALVIRATMGPPVLFRQVRPGKNKKPFTLLKFRTMNEARGGNGRLLPDSRRLTPLGRFLRRTSLDELPQLVNVLTGDMSIVGPRPLLCRYLPYYTERECLRFAVRPGITGWAQIHGRNLLGWDERLAFDAWYVENWSLALDCRILLRTLLACTTQKGLVVDPRSTGGLDLDEERGNLRKESANAQGSPC